MRFEDESSKYYSYLARELMILRLVMAADRTYNEDIAYFIAFCVEIYKNANNLSGSEVCDLFEQHNVMDYLADNFEVLHTQSPQWILDEITELVSDATK